MKNKIFLIIFCIFLISGFLPVTNGFLNVNDYIDQEQTNCGGSYWATSYPGNLAQSFMPSLNTLTRVKFYGFRNNTPFGNLKISIKNSLHGDDLTSLILTPLNISNNPSWIEIDFTNIRVTPETTYFIVWVPTSNEDNESNSYYWCDTKGNSRNDPYNRGEQFLLGERQDWADFCFQTYGYSIPSIIITSPSNEDDIGGLITIQGTADDFDGYVQKVEVRIDDGNWLTVTGTNTWNYEWDTRTVINGFHTIYARSFDGESYSDTVSVNVIIKNTGISIENLNGGYNVLSANLHNIGDNTANNIKWDIILQGGFFNLLYVDSTGAIPTLQSDGVYMISTDEKIFGIGIISISINAEADNSESIQIEREGFIIGPFLKII